MLSISPSAGAAGARGVDPRPRSEILLCSVPPKVQYGTASWYGAKAQGRLMASGEPFDENALVAAHRTLPLGTAVIVTNLRNGLSVSVRIMDRGPTIQQAGSSIFPRPRQRQLGFVQLRPDNRLKYKW